jgi:hypothetical protein
MNHKTLSLCGWLLVSTGLLSGLFFTWFALILRDGIGPDSIESTGVRAVFRTLKILAIPGALSALVSGVGIALLRKANRKRAHAIAR